MTELFQWAAIVSLALVVSANYYAIRTLLKLKQESLDEELERARASKPLPPPAPPRRLGLCQCGFCRDLRGRLN